MATQVSDIEFCRLASGGTGRVFSLRVCVCDPNRPEFVAERVEVSLRTADPETAALVRDVIFDLLDKAAMMTPRTRAKMTRYRENLEPTKDK